MRMHDRGRRQICLRESGLEHPQCEQTVLSVWHLGKGHALPGRAPSLVGKRERDLFVMTVKDDLERVIEDRLAAAR